MHSVSFMTHTGHLKVPHAFTDAPQRQTRFGNSASLPTPPPKDLPKQPPPQKSWRKWLRSLLTVGILAATLIVPDMAILQRNIRNLFRSKARSGLDHEQAHPSLYTSAKLIPDHFELKPYQENQGDNNGCGTTSLSICLNMIRPGEDVTRASIDSSIRRADIYATPDSLSREARRQGFEAEIYNDSNLLEIQQHLLQGNPVIAMVKTGTRGKSFTAHYVVVYGYGKTPEGQWQLKISDPAGGQIYSQSWTDFQEQWRDIDIGGVSSGHHNLILVVSDNPLPASRYHYNFLNTCADNLARIINTGTSLVSADVKSLWSKDTQNGNLLRLGTILACAISFLRTRKQKPTDVSVSPTPQPQNQ